MANRKIREINLECGAVVHVNPESLDNAELLDAVVEGDEGDVRAVSRTKPGEKEEAAKN